MAERVAAGQSLARRLILLALGWTGIILLIAFVALSTVSRSNVEKAFDRRLQIFLKLLIADVVNAVDDQTVVIGGNLGEPLFNLPQSGWYWQIARSDKTGETRQSRSLWDVKSLSFQGDRPADPAIIREGYIDGPNDQSLRAVERHITLGTDGDYDLLVAGNAEDIWSAVRRFDLTLAGALLLMGAVLLFATFMQVRTGLLPLENMRSALAAIRKGQAAHLLGRFPSEVLPLALEINALIDANAEVVERSRTHVSNLAHALKTPLSVLQNEATAGGPVAPERLVEQVAVMREQVERHLQRARNAARIQSLAASVDVAPVIDSIARTLMKIHRDKGIQVEAICDPSLRFRGERQDLEELVGNLADNACKWGKSLVRIAAVAVDNEPGGRPMLTLCVEDDGAGLPQADMAQIGRRGLRLDEAMPGTGFGLSIVKDLAELYGGSLTISSSTLGGLQATLALPLA